MKKGFLHLFLLFMFLFSGCSAPKSVKNDTYLKEQKNVQNDLVVSQSENFAEYFYQKINTIFDENETVGISQTKYDTDKQADEKTGKYPVKEENNIQITRKKISGILEEKTAEKQQENKTKLDDKSKDKSGVEVKSATEIKQTNRYFDVICYVIAGIAILLLIKELKRDSL